MKSTLKPVLAMETLNVSKKVMVQNAQGLHARPADLFVKTANRYSSSIEVTKGSETVYGKSILNILTLAAEQGTELKILAIGDHAHEALAALTELFEQGFE